MKKVWNEGPSPFKIECKITQNCALLKLMCVSLSVRFMLKKTKPGLVSSNSSARLLEDVVVDKDNYDHLIQSSRVRLYLLVIM